MFKTIFVLALMLLVAIINLTAATLEETLQSLSGAAAESYVNPMVSAFGSDMNGGWFHKAPRAKKFKWDLEFGVVMMGTMFGDSDKDFSVSGNFNFSREQAQTLVSNYSSNPAYNDLVEAIMDQPFTVSISGPTITGPTYDDNGTPNDPDDDLNTIDIDFAARNIMIDGNPYSIEQNIIRIPVGGILEDLPMLPLAAPQLSLGTIYGTKIALRYLPEIELTPEIGSLKYLGYGIQHNPAIWLPVPIPVDVALAFFTQQLDIGTIIETSASTYGLNVSKTFGLKLMSVTPYAGFSGESSKMKFSYDYILETPTTGAPVTSNVSFDVEGKNTSRLTAGLSFRLAILNFNVDYNLAKYPSATAGIMFNFSW